MTLSEAHGCGDHVRSWGAFYVGEVEVVHVLVLDAASFSASEPPVSVTFRRVGESCVQRMLGPVCDE